MIEIHSHILPGVDDGAVDMTVSSAMLNEYLTQGVNNVICTPHFNATHYKSTTAFADFIGLRQIQFNLLNSYAVNHYPGIELHMGAEIMLSADCLGIIQKYGRSKNLTLAGSDFILVEFPHHLSGGYKLLDRLFFGLQMSGFIPVLAHPERAMKWEGMFETLVEWYAQDKILIQINASSLVTDPHISQDRQARYSKRKKYARMLIEANTVDFISSDAHDNKERPPQNLDAWHAVASEYGQNTANNLLTQNAKEILQKKDNLRKLII